MSRIFSPWFAVFLFLFLATGRVVWDLSHPRIQSSTSSTQSNSSSPFNLFSPKKLH